MIAHRPFTNYEEYVYKQGGKARGRREHLLAHAEKNTEGFARTFKRAEKYLKPGAILCLGARTGAESIGAVKAGFRGSVGIDLHPVGPTVLRGDWHELIKFTDATHDTSEPYQYETFSEASFSNVYSNSLDHCLYLDQLADGVKRVLVPGGRFYVMASNREGHTVEAWKKAWSKSNEGLYWDDSDDLRNAIVSLGFTLIKEWRDGKWGHYVFGVK